MQEIVILSEWTYGGMFYTYNEILSIQFKW